MAGVIVRDEPFIRLPIYYLNPVEIVAMAMHMGEGKWKDCELAGKKRRHPHVRAVALGAEVRATGRRARDIPEFRPPPEWMKDAGINFDTLRRAIKVITE